MNAVVGASQWTIRFDLLLYSFEEVHMPKTPRPEVDLFTPRRSTVDGASAGAQVVGGLIVTEPLGNGIRVTARDHDERLLWGYIAGQLSLDSPHVLVATYDALRKHVIRGLPHYVDSTAVGAPATKQCLDAIGSITAMLEKVRDRLSPKNVSDKTEKRAAECLPALRDIMTLITFELTDRRPSQIADSGE